MTNVIMLGPPGSGKGTQAERLSHTYGWPQISTGNILRHAIEAKTELGLKAKDAMDAGELVSDEIVDGIVAERISHDDCIKGFILDGFPRDLIQAKALDEIRKIDVVFDIRVPEEELVERLSMRRVCDCGETYHLKYNPPQKEGVCNSCGRKLYHREDDKVETIRHRLQVYHSQTEPLIHYYSGKGVLVDIDGTKHIDDVFKNIVSNLPDEAKQ
ncbi:MAG: adenylate kinase [Candidatus Altiarchaeota archaeon]|nr:adenylate kinase [Candidatus Altiarchaeota archaeon]